MWFNRHPARLQITPQAIVHLHRGQSEGLRLINTGHLYISRTMIGGKHPVAYLRVAGSEEAIPMGSFSPAKIREATLGAGWTWGERRPSR